MMLGDPSVRLREAVIEGNLLIVKRLLRRFPCYLTNIDPTNGWTSLHYASYHGRYLICVYLIQLGHDKRELATTFKGNTCVHLALMNGHEQTTHLLLQYFPGFIDRPGEHGRAPIHIACMHDHFQCLSLLMGVGAKLDIPDDDGDTPLHVCLEYGSIHCMKLLVIDGGIVNDNAKNNLNWKPSDVAETFELAKLYAKTLKEAQLPGLPRKPSYNSFRTPVLTSKSVFDDGPSPVLTMNSPYSIYAQTAPIPQLPRISTSRRPSAAVSIKSPIANTSFQSRLASKDSSLTSSSSSLNKKDTRNSVIDWQRTTSSSEVSPEKREPAKMELPTDGGRLTGHLARNGSPVDSREQPSPQEGRKRRISLLNIPVAKLRQQES